MKAKRSSALTAIARVGAERALLAKHEASGLFYSGAAFLTLGGEAREALNAKAKELAQERPILRRNARWVRPEGYLKGEASRGCLPSAARYG